MSELPSYVMPKNLAAALLRAQASIRDPERNAQNEHLRNYYATLDEVLRVVRDPLREQGILLTQRVETVPDMRARNTRMVSRYQTLPEERNGRVTKPGRDVEETREVVGGMVHELTTVLLHPDSGEHYAMRTALSPATDSPQDVASAVTYYRRCHIKVLCALAEVDDDGELAAAAADEQRTRNVQKKAAPTPASKIMRKAAPTPAAPTTPPVATPEAAVAALAPTDNDEPGVRVVRAAEPPHEPTEMEFDGWIHEARDLEALARIMRAPKGHLDASARTRLRTAMERKKAELANW